MSKKEYRRKISIMKKLKKYMRLSGHHIIDLNWDVLRKFDISIQEMYRFLRHGAYPKFY